ncbi:MAG: ankyrin repeat domain-containing protein, partial [Leptospiraceae bacterium]|nr:ankyrin repeat domain-containing protein [Leptospiraceae bacterium]
QLGIRMDTGPAAQKPEGIQGQGLFSFRSGALTVDRTNRRAVAQFFKDHYVPYNQVQNQWTGSVNGCRVGANSKAYDEATLQNLQYYRAMAGVPSDVSFDEKYNAKARAAALIMEAKNDLSHNPPTNWPCYSQEGAKGAGSSNLCLGCVGPNAIDAYVQDNGVGGVGHRHWALHPKQKVLGTGSSKRAHALYVFGDWRPDEEVSSIKAVVWPPEGYVPFKFGLHPDYPWSYQSFADSSSHKDAQVKMTHNGKNVSLRKEQGNNGILVWYPTGLPDTYRSNDWKKDGDYKVDVEITNLIVDGKAQTIRYSVTFIDPEAVLQENNTDNSTTTDTENTTAIDNETQNNNETNTTTNPSLNPSLLAAAYHGKTEMVKDLLKRGAEPNAKSGDGWTSLMYAAYFGFPDIARALMEQGADPNVEVGGWTAAALAQRLNHSDVLSIITSASRTSQRSMDSKTRSLEKAPQPGQPDGNSNR